MKNLIRTALEIIKNFKYDTSFEYKFVLYHVNNDDLTHPNSVMDLRKLVLISIIYIFKKMHIGFQIFS